jgi:hypothetical protein
MLQKRFVTIFFPGGSNTFGQFLEVIHCPINIIMVEEIQLKLEDPNIESINSEIYNLNNQNITKDFLFF